MGGAGVWCGAGLSLGGAECGAAAWGQPEVVCLGAGSGAVQAGASRAGEGGGAECEGGSQDHWEPERAAGVFSCLPHEQGTVAQHSSGRPGGGGADPGTVAHEF